MEKNPFDIIAEMNKADTKNGTRNVAVSPTFVEAKKCPQGALVTMGCEVNVIDQLARDEVMVLLLVVNKQEYSKKK